MRKSRFSQSQIVAILGESERGVKTAELHRRHGVHPYTFYRWKAKYGGMSVSDVAKLKQLEEENSRLKRIVANLTLDNDALKFITQKTGDAFTTTERGGGGARAISRERASSMRSNRMQPAHAALPAAPAIEADTSLPAARVTRTLDAAAAEAGAYPEWITADNGSELTSMAMLRWAHERGVQLRFIAPRKPIQNAFIESFNGKLRNECLNEHSFASIDEARQILEAWRRDYNENRPHASLGDRTPDEFAHAAIISKHPVCPL